MKKPFQGPSVTWNYKDVRRMVKAFGFESTVYRLTGDMFNMKYVEKAVNNFLDKNYLKQLKRTK